MKQIMTLSSLASIRVAITVFPGSNCAEDMQRYFPNSFYIWHATKILDNDMDLLNSYLKNSEYSTNVSINPIRPKAQLEFTF